ALSLFLIAAMLSEGSLQRLPIALVDEAASTASRSLASALAGQGGLAIKAHPASEIEADALLRSGNVWGYVVIPGDCDGAVTGAVAAEARDFAGLRGLDLDPEGGPQLQVRVLFNPQASLEWYLQALLDPAMLHLLAACLGAYIVAFELRDGSLAAWRAETGG